MKTVCWLLFFIAIVSVLLGILEAMFPGTFAIYQITPGGYLRFSNTLLLFAIALYLLKKP